jgi:hypothetical protein
VKLNEQGVGDALISINGHEVRGMLPEHANALLRGRVGTRIIIRTKKSTAHVRSPSAQRSKTTMESPSLASAPAAKHAHRADVIQHPGDSAAEGHQNTRQRNFKEDITSRRSAVGEAGAHMGNADWSSSVREEIGFAGGLRASAELGYFVQSAFEGDPSVRSCSACPDYARCFAHMRIASKT